MLVILVLQIHVLQLHALQVGPAISCLSFSAPPVAGVAVERPSAVIHRLRVQVPTGGGSTR